MVTVFDSFILPGDVNLAAEGTASSGGGGGGGGGEGLCATESPPDCTRRETEEAGTRDAGGGERCLRVTAVSWACKPPLLLGAVPLLEKVGLEEEEAGTSGLAATGPTENRDAASEDLDMDSDCLRLLGLSACIRTEVMLLVKPKQPARSCFHVAFQHESRGMWKELAYMELVFMPVTLHWCACASGRAEPKRDLLSLYLVVCNML